jgi:AcrR family transcriptional regulator
MPVSKNQIADLDNFFNQHRPSEIDISVLSRELGISVSQIYYQYGSKSELLRVLANEVVDSKISGACRDFQNSFLESGASSSPGQLLEALRIFFDSIWELVPNTLCHLHHSERQLLLDSFEQFSRLFNIWLDLALHKELNGVKEIVKSMVTDQIMRLTCQK